MLYNLLDYGKEYTEKILMKEEITYTSLNVINLSIKEQIKLRENFDLYEDGKLLNSLNNLRRNIRLR